MKVYLISFNTYKNYIKKLNRVINYCFNGKLDIKIFISKVVNKA